MIDFEWVLLAPTSHLRVLIDLFDTRPVDDSLDDQEMLIYDRLDLELKSRGAR